MKAIRWHLLAGLLAVTPVSAEIGDEILITFDSRPDFDFRDTVPPLTGQGLTNPPTHVATPMVSLGGVAFYQDTWAVYAAHDGSSVTNLGGDATITLDQVPPLPAGSYEVNLNMIVGNWNNGSPAGIALGGTGVTEIGNEMPGAFHFFYPTSNTGLDMVEVQIASSKMGPAAHGGSEVLLDPDGNPAELLTGTPGAPIWVGSAPTIFNDGNSFPLQIKLDPGNQLVLSVRDGAAVSTSHLRLFWMRLTEVAPILPPTLRITDLTRDTQGDVTITWESDPDSNYTVQTSVDLESTWEDVRPDVPGAGATSSWTDGDPSFTDPNPASATLPGKFYRVRKN